MVDGTPWARCVPGYASGSCRVPMLSLPVTSRMFRPEGGTASIRVQILVRQPELVAGQPKSRVQARIGASRAGLRPIWSRSSPMDKSGLKFC